MRLAFTDNYESALGEGICNQRIGRVKANLNCPLKQTATHFALSDSRKSSQL
jgi:hypothetical protein